MDAAGDGSAWWGVGRGSGRRSKHSSASQRACEPEQAQHTQWGGAASGAAHTAAQVNEHIDDSMHAQQAQHQGCRLHLGEAGSRVHSEHTCSSSCCMCWVTWLTDRPHLCVGGDAHTHTQHTGQPPLPAAAAAHSASSTPGLYVTHAMLTGRLRGLLGPTRLIHKNTINKQACHRCCCCSHMPH
jgi:hypothetical protein